MPKYRHKTHALQSAVKVWVCKSCGQPHYKVKPEDCEHCGFNVFYYFASKFEAKRFAELCMLQKGGLITDLETQVPFSLDVNGTHICRYVADFQYMDTNTGKVVVEDTKGDPQQVTGDFKLKAKMMQAIHGIDVQVVYQSARRRRH